MKAFNYFILSVFLFSSINLYSQKKIALHSSGTSSFYEGANALMDAYNNAIDGDTIYIPSGQYNFTSIFGKRLTLFGVGYHPDSLSSFGITILNGLTLNTGASNSYFEGISFTSGITFTTNNKIDSVKIIRSHINGNISIGGTNGNSTGIEIRENVISGSISAANTSNLIIHNNIIHAHSANIISNISNNAWIANNVILGRGYVLNYTHHFAISNLNNCLIENNIIFSISTTSTNVFATTCINNTFINNLFEINPENTTNTWINNYKDISTTNLFIDFSSTTSFSFNNNYNLTNPSLYPGTTLNEVGIYGGLNPVKTNTLPKTPHIKEVLIPLQTDSNGGIQVNIKVIAQ